MLNFVQICEISSISVECEFVHKFFSYTDIVVSFNTILFSDKKHCYSYNCRKEMKQNDKCYFKIIILLWYTIKLMAMDEETLKGANNCRNSNTVIVDYCC